MCFFVASHQIFLMFSIEDRGTPLTTQFTQSMPSQRNRSSVGECLQSEAVTTLDKVVTLKEVFICFRSFINSQEIE